MLGFGPASLAAGASVHVHITSPTTGATCGTVSNSATADSTNDGSPAVGPIAIVVNCPDLGLTKTADAASASAGDPIGYTLTISNTGQGNATGVELADSLPGGNAATPVTWVIDGTTGNPGSFSLTGGPGSQVLSLAGQPITLAPGQSLVVHVTAATTSASCATYNNSASLVSTNDGSPAAARSRSPSTAPSNRHRPKPSLRRFGRSDRVGVSWSAASYLRFWRSACCSSSLRVHVGVVATTASPACGARR